MELVLTLVAALLIILVLSLTLGSRIQRLRAREREIARLHADLARFRQIVDIEAEVARLRTQAATEHQQLGQHMLVMHREAAALEQRIVELRREAAALDDALMFAEHGLYQPLYDFDSSERYRQQLDRVREHQKQLVKDGQAAICRTTWMVEGNAAKGRKMIADQLKLVLRAFNGDCDAVIAKVRYDNYHALEKRIEKSYETVNKLVAVNHCEITRSYFRLKIDELRLTHEYQEKLQAEREEQRMIKERMRDEQLAAKELEKAERDAAREEVRIAELLARTQEQAEQAAAGAKHDRLMAKIAELEGQLATASEARQRAISRAQKTRSGHVYVISNIGSFGQDVYKIGMTRRQDPHDRVKELGDASVPFRFDVHAMIYCEDAPALESKLHRALANHQVNLVNNRKEFFRVTIAQIEEVVARHHARIELTRWAEAEEYRKTEALRATQEPNGAANGAAIMA